MRTLLACLVLIGFFTSTALAQKARFRDPIFTSVDVTTNIAYGSAVNAFTKKTEILRLDLYQPRGDSHLLRPSIVIVHGGGFRSGDKGTSQFVRMGNDLARQGFVAISINYRLKPSNKPTTLQVITDAAHDFKASVRWLRRQAKSYRIDTGRIGSVGSSAGAYTVLHAAYVPGEGSSGNAGYSSEQQAVVDLWGGLTDIKAMDKGEAPLCIIHGTKDSTVPFQRAIDLKNRAILVGVPYEYHPLVGAGHAPWSLYSQFQPDMTAFYWEHLRLGELAALSATPGATAPGNLKLEQFGIATDFVILYVAAKKVSLSLPGLGTLCLDPSQLISVQVLGLATTPRLPATSFSIAVPASLKGKSLNWQALHLTSQPGLRLLSNCVTTAF